MIGVGLDLLLFCQMTHLARRTTAQHGERYLLAERVSFRNLAAS